VNHSAHSPPRYRPYQRRDIDSIPQLRALAPEERLAMKAVSTVLPFRTNAYVCDELIDWSRVPDDPIYQLTFPQRGMLEPADLALVTELVRSGAPTAAVAAAAREIQGRLNPHPAGQRELNVPHHGKRGIPGLQHKYRETVLFFPAQGQTCHAFCTYCFRWPQFVGIDELKFAARESEELVSYLRRQREVLNVLVTGGDPLTMKAKVLRRYLEPLLDPSLAHVTTIRIGTKALAYWPHRVLDDEDADDLLRLFGEVRAAGRHLALMAHYSHPRELQTPAAQRAVRRVQDAGAVVRTQAPLIRRVNDDPGTWSEMWRLQVRLGAVPYYMFVERDTGPKRYFEVPLARAAAIYRDAHAAVSGLARTARGPSMSATPGKVVVDGVATVAGERVFALRFLQARDPAWVGRPFFARFDPLATWLDQLRPAFGEREFFFAPGMRAMATNAAAANKTQPSRVGSVMIGRQEAPT